MKILQKRVKFRSNEKGCCLHDRAVLITIFATFIFLTIWNYLIITGKLFGSSLNELK